MFAEIEAAFETQVLSWLKFMYFVSVRLSQFTESEYAARQGAGRTAEPLVKQDRSEFQGGAN